MKPSRAILFLPLVLALALVVRWAPTRDLRLAPDERDLGASQWLIDDPETCQHLRRIELGIAGDRVPEIDRFVNHPFGGEIPALPLFDTLFAGISQRFQRNPAGEIALSHVEEASIEDLCVQLSPILGLLATLCVFWATSTLTNGPRKTHAAVLASLVFALHPAAIACSSAGVLDAAVLAAALLALLVRFTVRSLRTDTMPTVLLDALIAGALAGFSISVSAAGFVVYAAVWIGFFTNVIMKRGDSRANALRAGLFFTAVAAFVARMPLAEGPWEATSGSVLQGFSSGVSLLVLLSLAPFLVLVLLGEDAKKRIFRSACFVAGLAVMAWQLPEIWRDFAPTLRWFTSEHASVTRAIPALASVFTGSAFEIATALVGALALLVTWFAARTRRLDSAQFLLLALALLTFAFALVVRGAMPLFVVALSLQIGVAYDLATSEETTLQADDVDATRSANTSANENKRSRLASRGALACVVVLFAGGLVPALVRADPALREERIAFVAGLRWMRLNTPSGGPWNSPQSTSEWGVLSNVADGPLVQYHARRPALTSPSAVLSGLPFVREASLEFHASAPDRFVRFLQGQRVAYVVVGPRADRRRLEVADPLRPDLMHADLMHPDRMHPDRMHADSLHSDPIGLAEHSPFDSLAFTAVGAADEIVPGLTRVFASPRRIGPDGRAARDGERSGPVISIYALKERSVDAPRAEMRPR